MGPPPCSLTTPAAMGTTCTYTAEDMDMVLTDITTTTTGHAGTTVEREGERGGEIRERGTDPETMGTLTGREVERRSQAMSMGTTIIPIGVEAEMAVIDANKCVVM